MYYSWELTLVTVALLPFFAVAPFIEGRAAKEENLHVHARVESAATVSTYGCILFSKSRILYWIQSRFSQFFLCWDRVHRVDSITNQPSPKQTRNI